MEIELIIEDDEAVVADSDDENADVRGDEDEDEDDAGREEAAEMGMRARLMNLIAGKLD